jgi:Uma2 family endonuclease
VSIEPSAYARLREIADRLPQMPGIGRVEIADGEIVMMMSPVRRHELAVLRLTRQLNAQLEQTHPGMVAFAGADLEDAGLGRLRRPDIMVFPEEALEAADPPALTPHEVLLVVEIVAKSSPANDHENKVADYSAMGIPHYLLVDPRDGTGIVHSLPGYSRRTPFVFGDMVEVGPWRLDTGGLSTYAS